MHVRYMCMFACIWVCVCMCKLITRTHTHMEHFHIVVLGEGPKADKGTKQNSFFAIYSTTQFINHLTLQYYSQKLSLASSNLTFYLTLLVTMESHSHSHHLSHQQRLQIFSFTPLWLLPSIFPARTLLGILPLCILTM